MGDRDSIMYHPHQYCAVQGQKTPICKINATFCNRIYTGHLPKSVTKGQQAQQSLPAQAWDAAASKRLVSELDAANSRLRKKLAGAKLAIEILRKATGCVAKGAR